MTNPTLPPAKMTRRLLAILYDSFLMLALLLFAAAVPLIFTAGKPSQGSNPFLTLYLVLVCFVFFAWFWTHGGQTLGMRAWRLQLQRLDGGKVDWKVAAIRFITGLPAWLIFILGLAMYFLPETQLPGLLKILQQLPNWALLAIGCVWLALDNRPNSLRDSLSKTRVVQLPKPSPQTTK